MTTAQDAYEHFWATVRKGDYEGIRYLLSPGFELHLPGMKEPMGIEAGVQAARAWGAGFSDFGHNQEIVKDLLGDNGRTYAAVVEETLTHDGEFVTPGGVFPPSGNIVDLTSIHMFQIGADGKMTRWYIEFDMTGFAESLRR